jgi:hypothetical protein
MLEPRVYNLNEVCQLKLHSRLLILQNVQAPLAEDTSVLNE